MEEAKKTIPNLTAQMGNIQPQRQAKMYSTSGRDRIPYPELEKKLNKMYSHASGYAPENLRIVKVMLDDFLQGQDINVRFAFGQPHSKINELVIRGLINIYTNAKDTGLQVRAKQTIKEALNPLLNPQLALKIIDVYNKSKYNKYPVKKIDNTVNSILEKGFEMYFDYLWDIWMKNNIGPDNTFITGNFIGFIYDTLTGKNGTRKNGWFGPYYNDFKKNPEKFQPTKAIDPAKVKLDRSEHTISDVIKYIYNPGGKVNLNRIDMFEKANKDIVNYLKKNVQNPLSWKVFQYVVMNKLDSEEIVDIDKKYFPNTAKATGAFTDLAGKNKKAAEAIDMIYKNYKLALPKFSTWKSSDLNKSSSDRGELQADAPELGRDEKGNLAKIKYNKMGDKTISPLQELRLMIRNLLQEHFKNKPNNNLNN